MGKEMYQMKTLIKITVFFFAVLLSVAAFNFIAGCTCADDLFALNQPLHYDITVYPI